MKLVWHIIKKDLRHRKWEYIIWAAAGMLAMIYFPPFSRSPAETGDYLGMVSLIGYGVLSIALIVSSVQEDGLVDDNAFWRSRPISGARLLAAKLIPLLVFFVLVPVAAIVLAAWVKTDHFQVSWSGLGVALLGTFAITMVFTSFASCTRDLVHCCLVWLFSILAGIGLAFWLGRLASPVGRSGIMLSKMVVIFGGCGLLGLGVLYQQYIARRLKVAIGLIAVGVVGSALIGAFWTWNLMR